MRISFGAALIFRICIDLRIPIPKKASPIVKSIPIMTMALGPVYVFSNLSVKYRWEIHWLNQSSPTKTKTPPRQ